MTRRQRFDLAVAGYRDVSDQLRRWEALLTDQGDSAKVARTKVHEHLHTLNLFRLHDAMFALERGDSAEAVAVFEKEVAQFEDALGIIRAKLSNDGVPVV